MGSQSRLQVRACALLTQTDVFQEYRIALGTSCEVSVPEFEDIMVMADGVEWM